MSSLLYLHASHTASTLTATYTFPECWFQLQFYIHLCNFIYSVITVYTAGSRAVRKHLCLESHHVLLSTWLNGWHGAESLYEPELLSRRIKGQMLPSRVLSSLSACECLHDDSCCAEVLVTRAIPDMLVIKL